MSLADQAKVAQTAHQSVTGHADFDHVMNMASDQPVVTMCNQCGWTWSWETATTQRARQEPQVDPAAEAEAIESIRRAIGQEQGVRTRRAQARKSRLRRR